MEKNEVYKLARGLMDHHGLENWKLEWMSLKTVAGLCYTYKFDKDPLLSRGKIELSTHFMLVFTEEEVRETVLHEISHGLVPPGVASHGPEWKHMAKKIGSTGERCVGVEEAAKTVSKYKGTCPQGHVYPRHRRSWYMTTSSTYCPLCSKKKLKATLSWVDTHTGHVLNPYTKTILESTKAPATTEVKAAKTPMPIAKVAPSNWKERFDKGDTSFADVW